MRETAAGRRPLVSAVQQIVPKLSISASLYRSLPPWQSGTLSASWPCLSQSRRFRNFRNFQREPASTSSAVSAPGEIADDYGQRPCSPPASDFTSSSGRRVVLTGTEKHELRAHMQVSVRHRPTQRIPAHTRSGRGGAALLEPHQVVEAKP